MEEIFFHLVFYSPWQGTKLDIFYGHLEGTDDLKKKSRKAE